MAGQLNVKLLVASVHNFENITTGYYHTEYVRVFPIESSVNFLLFYSVFFLILAIFWH